MPKVGVEPTLPEENYALNVARLPIPPLRQASSQQYSRNHSKVKIPLKKESPLRALPYWLQSAGVCSGLAQLVVYV